LVGGEGLQPPAASIMGEENTKGKEEREENEMGAQVFALLVADADFGARQPFKSGRLVPRVLLVMGLGCCWWSALGVRRRNIFSSLLNQLGIEARNQAGANGKAEACAGKHRKNRRTRQDAVPVSEEDETKRFMGAGAPGPGFFMPVFATERGGPRFPTFQKRVLWYFLGAERAACFNPWHVPKKRNCRGCIRMIERLPRILGNSCRGGCRSRRGIARSPFLHGLRRDEMDVMEIEVFVC